MRIAAINMVNVSSTGKIMLQVAETARKQGMEAVTFSPPGFSIKHPDKKVKIPGHRYYGTRVGHGIHAVVAQRNGKNGDYSRPATLQLLWMLSKFQPDVVHLHNLHGWCINLPMLFSYLKTHKIPVVWTLHDCWSFTGQCAYFEITGCQKWKTGCYECPALDVYPNAKKDITDINYQKKKDMFTGLPSAVFVTPSQWLAGLVKESFLKDYPVRVINNGIDLSVFRPTPGDFREKYGCAERFILLGVSFGWGERKGLDVFIELAKRLDDRFAIVLVGTDEGVEAMLPKNIIAIRQTTSARELAEIYSAADLFVNPTREENYPTVNMEALACGTPILSFRTGGSPEILDETCGCVVSKNDADAMEQEILRIRETRPFTREACLKRAESFDKNQKFLEYIALYREIEKMKEKTDETR